MTSREAHPFNGTHGRYARQHHRAHALARAVLAMTTPIHSSKARHAGSPDALAMLGNQKTGRTPHHAAPYHPDNWTLDFDASSVPDTLQ